MQTMATCQACGKARPLDELDHHQIDRGFEIDEPPGTVFTHVFLCADDPDCQKRGQALLTTGDPYAGYDPYQQETLVEP